MFVFYRGIQEMVAWAFRFADGADFLVVSVYVCLCLLVHIYVHDVYGILNTHCY